MRKETKAIISLILISLFLVGCTDTPQTNLNEDQTLEAGQRYMKEIALSSSANVNIKMTADQAVDVFLFNYHNYEKFKNEESTFSFIGDGSEVNTYSVEKSLDLPDGQWILVVDNTPNPSFGAEGNQPAEVEVEITTKYLTKQVSAPDATKIWVSEDIDEEEFSLGDFGGKPLVIYFMSLTTYPATTINQMYQLKSAHKNLDVNIICVEMESTLKQVEQLVDNFVDTNNALQFTFTFDENNVIRNSYNKNDKFPYIVILDDQWDIHATLQNDVLSEIIEYKTIEESIADL